jgi:S1-C subfamily serine protease
MQIKQTGVTSGRIDCKVTMINYSGTNNTNGPGTPRCKVTFVDAFQTSICGTNGDSGGPLLSDDGYYVGIITYGTTEHGGKNDRSCRGINPSTWHIPPVMGLTVQGGTTEPTPSGTQPTQQAQRRQQQRGWFGISSLV